jgi:hypothetical protein
VTIDGNRRHRAMMEALRPNVWHGLCLACGLEWKTAKEVEQCTVCCSDEVLNEHQPAATEAFGAEVDRLVAEFNAKPRTFPMTITDPNY